jgi:ATP-dependent RNA helicase RhlE
MLFSQLGLSAELLRAVEDQGYLEATPVQQKAIPLVLEGHDIMAGAQTGTGKTAGFTLPILQRLQKTAAHDSHPRVRVLILVPTRELAAQVAESVDTYGSYLPFRSAVIFGGVSINTQIASLRKGVDIVIATPGRLIDHLQRGTIKLDAVETLVLDEADRMLDMGFIHDIRKILNRMRGQRQTLLFSATFSKEIRQLAQEFLTDPQKVQIAARNTATDLVKQVVHKVDKARKRELLSYMIGSGNWRQVLVFTRTKHMANRLCQQLERDGLSAAAIHGNKTQGARTRALADFKSGKIRILVATDIAARGLDIELLPHVVNYELPNVPEDYIHRIGRTGRAGMEGEALSLVCIDELKLLEGIERLLKSKIEEIAIEGYAPDASIKAVPIRNGNNSRPQKARGNNGRRPSNQGSGKHHQGSGHAGHKAARPSTGRKQRFARAG